MATTDEATENEKSRWVTIASVTLQLLAAFSLLLSGFVIQELHERSACNSKFAQRTAAIAPALNREREAREATDMAQANLWLAVRPGTPSGPDIIEKFKVYQNTLKERIDAVNAANEARAKHPIPECTP